MSDKLLNWSISLCDIFSSENKKIIQNATLLSNNHDKLNHVVRIGTSPFMEQEDTYIAFTRSLVCTR